jgi:hypothetical protein
VIIHDPDLMWLTVEPSEDANAIQQSHKRSFYLGIPRRPN